MIASIEDLPPSPETAYLPYSSLDKYLAQLGKVTKGKTNGMFLREGAAYYEALNAQLAEVARDLQRIRATDNIPIPKLVIMNTKEPNSFVMPLASCSRNQVVMGGFFDPSKKMPAVYFEGAKAKESPNTYRPDIPPSDGILDYSDMVDSCEDQGVFMVSFSDETLLHDLEGRYLNDGSSFSLNDGPTYPALWSPGKIPGRLTYDKMKLVPGINLGKNTVTYGELAVERTMPYVFLTSGLIAGLRSYEELRAVFAHELGHYYLGHAYAITRPRGYFYDRTTQKKAFRPPESVALAKTGNDLIALGNMQTGRSVPGMFSHPLSGEVLVSAIRGLRPTSFSEKEWAFDAAKCAPVLQTPLSEVATKFLYAENLSSTDEQRWQAYFKALRECTETVRWAGKKTAWSRPDPTFRNYFSQTPPKLDLLDVLLDGVKLAPAANAWEAFQRMEPAMSQKVAGLQDGGDFKKIGYYTYEEEADVFALNYLLTYHRSQADLQKALANLVRREIALDPAAGHDLNDCLAAYQNNWKRNGQPYVPAPLNYDDAHHGFCFRLYNLDVISGRLGIYDNSARKSGGTENTDFEAIRAKYADIAKGLAL